MAIERFETDLAIISKLEDEPNDVGGLTAAQLKAKFDEAGQVIQTYLNDVLLPQLVAGNVPFTPTAAVNAQNVQDAILNVQAQLASVTLGVVPDGSVTPAKLAAPVAWFYRAFTAEEWTDTELRIPQSEHGLPVDFPLVSHTLRMLVDGAYVTGTWGLLESSLTLDTDTGDLVLTGSAAFAGDLFAMGAPRYEAG